MSAWPGKYVIGLTGNIATGKSVVRRMLEHLGAYGIDADALSHRAIALGAPGYQPVVDTFGSWIVNPDGQVDRARLGKIVFSDPHALARLEKIIHPLVRKAEDILIRQAHQKVIVVEAIKLLESGLGRRCDSIWVTYAPEVVQIARLMQKRGLSESAARTRLQAQPPQEEKIGAANVVIRNDKSFDETWKQVFAAWQKILPGEQEIRITTSELKDIYIQRAKPSQADEIARLIGRLSEGRRSLNREDIMAAFGEKAYLLLYHKGQMGGIVGWQVENLVVRIDELYVDGDVPLDRGLSAILEEVEKSSNDLQCEAALLFLAPEMAMKTNVWSQMGYRESSIQSLGVKAWQDAAIESFPAGAILWFKRLREDLVMKPV